NLQGKCKYTLQKHTDIVTCLALLNDGRIISGSKDYTLKIWRLSEQSPFDNTNDVTLVGHTDVVLSVAVLPDGRVASGSRNGCVKIWNITDQKYSITNN